MINIIFFKVPLAIFDAHLSVHVNATYNGMQLRRRKTVVRVVNHCS